jgi:DNA polymerase III delta subunit
LTACFLLTLVLIKVIFDALNELLKGESKVQVISAIYWHLLSMSQLLLLYESAIDGLLTGQYC